MSLNTGRKKNKETHTQSHAHTCVMRRWVDTDTDNVETISTQRERITTRGKTHWWSWYTYKYTHFYTNTQTAHKGAKKKVKISWVETKTQLLFSLFLPLSSTCRGTEFILQFIYTYIVSMHKRIAHPNPRTEVLWLVLFFFNMGIILTHIGDNFKPKISQKRCKNRNECPWCVIFTMISNNFLNYYVFLCI